LLGLHLKNKNKLPSCLFRRGIFYHRFRWYVTLENKTLAEMFPKFLSILHVIDRHVGSRSINRSQLAWRREGKKVTLVAVIGWFRSDMSIAYQRKWWQGSGLSLAPDNTYRAVHSNKHTLYSILYQNVAEKGRHKRKRLWRKWRWVPLEQLSGSMLIKYKEHVAATSVSFILQDRYNYIIKYMR